MFTICSALRFLNLKPNHHLHICIMPTKPASQLRLPQSESGFHVQTSAWTPCRYLGKRKNSVAIKQVSCSSGVSGVAGAKSVPIPQEQSQENVRAQGRDCNQPYKRRELTTGLPCRQQVLGRSCCKYLWSALENNSRLACAKLCTANSSPGIFGREAQKGGTGREKRQHLSAFNLYLQGQLYHKPARSRAGNCPQYWAEERTASEQPLRTAKPDLRGWPVQCKIKTPNCKFKRYLSYYRA